MGPWQAFLSKQSAGRCSASIRDKAREYKRIRSEGGPEWEELVELGKLGKAARREGGKAFGVKRRRTSSMPVSGSVALVVRGAAGPEDVVAQHTEQQRHLRKVRRVSAAAVRSREQQQQQDLLLWSKKAASDDPALSAFPSEVVQPAPSGTSALRFVPWACPAIHLARSVAQGMPVHLRRQLLDEWRALHQIHLQSGSPVVGSPPNWITRFASQRPTLRG